MSEPADEALRRARAHLREATIEGLEATRALLEAALRGSGLAEAAQQDGWLGELRHRLDEGIASMRANPGMLLPRALTEPLAAALDAEIARWERRSRTDPDARLVLRVFLGVREVLWEIGVGRDPSHPPEPPRRARPRARTRPHPASSAKPHPASSAKPHPASSAKPHPASSAKPHPASSAKPRAARRERVQRFDVEGP